MKLLFYSPVFYPSIGGIETINSILTENFSKAGIEVIVITPILLGRQDDDKRFNFKIIRTKKKSVLWKYYRWCDVYFQSVLSLKGVWPLLIRPKRWIVVHHTCYFHLWDHKPTLVSRIKWLCSRFACNIVVSKAVGERLKLHSYTVIGNAYDNKVFQCLNLKEREGFCFLGRLVSEKGCLLLLYAYKKYIKISRKHFKLTIIGDGDEKQRMQEFVMQNQLNNDVCFKGKLTGDDLVQELNQHKCLIVPSLYNEAFGIVVLEGIACGCYCIVSDGDGLQENIGDLGITFQKSNAEDLVNKMLKMENLQYTPSQEPINEHLSKYTPEYISQNYIDFILNSNA